MKNFETITKAPVYQITGNQFVKTGRILPPKIEFNGNSVTVTIPHANPMNLIQFSGFRKGETPTYILPSDAKILKRASNFSDGQASEATTSPNSAMDWAKEALSMIVSLAILFLFVYVISKAWKMGQSEGKSPVVKS